jgi:hypothetical protein
MPRSCGVNVCLSYRFFDGMIQLTLWCHPADAELHPKVKLREPAQFAFQLPEPEVPGFIVGDGAVMPLLTRSLISTRRF